MGCRGQLTEEIKKRSKELLGYEIDTIADLAEAEELLSADKYETMNPYNIMPDFSGISIRYFQQMKHNKAETITRLLSGLRSIPQPNSLKI